MAPAHPLAPPRLDPTLYHRTSLALAALAPVRPAPAATAAAWHNRLLGLGITVPLFFTHDLGWALSLPIAERQTEPLLPTGAPETAGAYRDLCRELLESASAIGETGLDEREDLLVVLLAHLLGPLSRRYASRGKSAPEGELPLAAAAYPLPVHYSALAAEADAAPRLRAASEFQAFLVEQRLSLLTQIELIDPATLRLLVKERPSSAGQGLLALREGSALAIPDLLGVLSDEAADVRDIVRFSQDLLPAAFEPRRSEQGQLYPVGGHASIERRGSLDSLLGSELVFDDTLFLHRLSDGEALYYGRERPREERPGALQILIDASASMRGLRQIFARGLAWALGQRLAARRRVSLRFFDGRLYEAQPLLARHETSALLSLLSFRSNRGRNYQRVFSDLLREQRRPAQSASPPWTPSHERQTLYIITHGECHVPARLIQELAQQAELFAVFIRPSSELRLEYLPWLHGYHVIEDAELAERAPRRRLALDIIERAARPAASR